MILFSQSTAVLHKYLNDELKILCLLHFFYDVAQNSQNSLSFPCSEKSTNIPGLWPRCMSNVIKEYVCRINTGKLLARSMDPMMTRDTLHHLGLPVIGNITPPTHWTEITCSTRKKNKTMTVFHFVNTHT